MAAAASQAFKMTGLSAEEEQEKQVQMFKVS